MNSPPTFQPESHPEEQSVPGKHYIPAKEKTDIYSSNHVFRTCAYCRVSTDSEMQQISFSLQQEHYQNLARDHPNWDLRKVYADEGISGTSLKKRDQFNAMLAACLRGEFDLILTKSVSRFGRNLVHCVSLVRELKNHNPPIGVFFETDNLFTLSEDSELKLSILATLAQEESVKKSESMIWSLEQRFKTERLLMPECYGYTREKDAYGRYVKEARLQIVEEEAIVVRFIFDAFLAGYPVASIAEILTSSGIPTKSGNSGWSEGGIRYILSNERYCGNVLTWKTFTVDVLEHKKRRNRENRDQYLYENFHEAIISAEQFEAAQVLLANRKYRVQSYPRMFVIDSGIFRGYVPVNHHWMNDDPNSYYEASGSVQSLSIPQRVSRRQFSTFNLAVYQVVRGAFLLTRAECPCISVTPAQITFNSVCQRKFSDVRYIQLLIHPGDRRIAIRPCKASDPHSIAWRRNEDRPYGSKVISCQYFSSALYQIMGWNPDYHYRIRGCWASRGEEQIIFFQISAAVPVAIVRSSSEEEKKSSVRHVPLCPEEWGDSFGEEFYAHEIHNSISNANNLNFWKSQSPGRPVSDSLTVKTPEELQNNLEELKAKRSEING